ncbi:MAG: hypothetical protein L0027_10085 [Candidatus Rokubacteria bacterium]|nr:hypothetical protein [Candidatus Rokubacteria bacterium]
MRRLLEGAVMGTLLVLGLTAPALAQGKVEVRSIETPQGRRFEVISPNPAPLDATRPRDADFYGDDVRIPYEPGFIEPFTTAPAAGPIKKVGLAGWTAPPGRGSPNNIPESPGWFALGIAIIFE